MIPPLQCPLKHEPVVTDDICIYCNRVLERIHFASAKFTISKEVARLYFNFHDPITCPDCTVL